MKIEEVLPHLRAGGKVRISGRDGWEFSLNELNNQFSFIALHRLDNFEIVKKLYKAEHVVEKDPDYDYIIDGNQYATFSEILPELGQKYKVTIEEITE